MNETHFEGQAKSNHGLLNFFSLIWKPQNWSDEKMDRYKNIIFSPRPLNVVKVSDNLLLVS